MSAREFWPFTGLSSHTINWGSRAESEETDFSEVVTRIYAGERANGRSFTQVTTVLSDDQTSGGLGHGLLILAALW